MRIYKNTAKTPPLMEAIDAHAEEYEAARQTRATGWQVRLHMAQVLDVDEKSITDKDVDYFIRRVGVVYLSRKIRGIGSTTAEKLCRDAHERWMELEGK